MSPRYNSAQDFYVAIQDSTNKTAVVKDAAAVNSAGWTEVKIPLSKFKGPGAKGATKLLRDTFPGDSTGRLFIGHAELQGA